MVIYTKKGDKGETGMFSNNPLQQVRVSKDSVKVEVLGAIDELNSYLGVVRSEKRGVGGGEIDTILRKIQENLLTIGSITGGSRLKFSKIETKRLEKVIDKLEKKLPVLRNFILPGGCEVGAQLQYARTLARRAERRIVALSKVEELRPEILTYLNRLSDTLFMLAREENFKNKVKEEVWKGSRK
jgi:cob(I)alamin adenosyltransferase